LQGVERMVGLFINTLPLRVRMNSGETLSQMLAGIQHDQSQMLSVQHVSLIEIQRECGFADLFDTVMVFENYPLDRAALMEPVHGLKIVDADMRDATHYPLSLVVVPDNQFYLRLDYDAARLGREKVREMSDRLLRLLEMAMGMPDVRCTAWMR